MTCLIDSVDSRVSRKRVEIMSNFADTARWIRAVFPDATCQSPVSEFRLLFILEMRALTFTV